jgi:hypothetical protein
MVGSPKPTSYESPMPQFGNPISSSPPNQSTRPRADRIGPIDFSQKVISVAIDLGILAEPVFDPTLLMGEVPGITRLYSA